MLSTCASPFVTQYKASFLRGHKLWIVMEYLGGGSCLDLVSTELFFRDENHQFTNSFNSSNLAISQNRSLLSSAGSYC